jgi:hypothetical protein
MNTSSVIEAPSGTAQQSVPHRPEFFRLPKQGVDPYFGLGRSFYYEAEARGWFKLVRLRNRGKQRGITLVPYDVVAAFIQREREAA